MHFRRRDSSAGNDVVPKLPNYSPYCPRHMAKMFMRGTSQDTVGFQRGRSKPVYPMLSPPRSIIIQLSGLVVERPP